MKDEELLTQLNRWHEENEFEKIIAAIEEIPQEQRDYTLTCQLARAYNNLAVPGAQGAPLLEKARALLDSVREQGEGDALWHYRMGYALYYLDREREALPYFQRSAELDPTDEDVSYFIRCCKDILAHRPKDPATRSTKNGNRNCGSSHLKTSSAGNNKGENPFVYKEKTRNQRGGPHGNRQQREAATQAMAKWLAHPAELGAAPALLECAGEFNLHGLHYYIFKYKKTPRSRWLLGVCGGYAGASLEHCGHLFSEMAPYREDTALEQAAALVEQLRRRYLRQAQEAEKRKANAGSFIHYVLLEQPVWEKAALLRQLKERWGIEEEPESPGQEKPQPAESDDAFVICYHGAMIAVSLMPAPIPGGEAEAAAAKNFLWPDGARQVKAHKAHLLVAVIGRGLPPVESGKLLVKVVTSCCRQQQALGIYTGHVVYPPAYYLHFAEMLEEDQLPIYNLVWFGLYEGKGGLCGYTCGMRNFGYDEMEVLDSAADPDALHNLLSSVASYVIGSGVVLKDGETVGFSAEQKLPITKSRGVAVQGDSLKIGF